MLRKWFPLKLNQSKHVTNSFGSWNFQYVLKTDLLGEQGVSTYEKKNLLTKHLWTRLGCHLPHAVHSVTGFCNFQLLFHLLPCACPISFPIVWYVQSKSRAVHAMTPWFPDATLTQVPCCLADHPDFLLLLYTNNWEIIYPEGGTGQHVTVAIAAACHHHSSPFPFPYPTFYQWITTSCPQPLAFTGTELGTKSCSW